MARGKLDYKESIPGYVWEFIDFNLGPKDATKLSLAYPVNMQALVDLIEFNLSLELGDILVTLCIQCHMQGFGFGDCIPLHIMSVDGDDVAFHEFALRQVVHALVVELHHLLVRQPLEVFRTFDALRRLSLC